MEKIVEICTHVCQMLHVLLLDQIVLYVTHVRKYVITSKCEQKLEVKQAKLGGDVHMKKSGVTFSRASSSAEQTGPRRPSGFS